MRIGRRLVVLALFGVAMTLAVVLIAFASLNEVSAVNRELARVNQALQYHKTADEMHDALRADVARAELAAAGRLVVSRAGVRRETHVHAQQFRSVLEKADRLHLSPSLETAFGRLRPIQEIYIQTAEAMVSSALSRKGTSPGAETDYEAAFAFLVPEQNRLTGRLMATTTQVERDAEVQRAEAESTISVAAAAALAGWLAMALWHHRSMRRLQGALVRETEQRSAAGILQQSLLPMALPDVAGATLAARSLPGASTHLVGGDWYDVVNLPSGEVLLVVGDVVGHDLPAASVMGQLRSSLRAYSLLDASPAGVLGRVNKAARVLDLSELATCICAVLDPRTTRLRWASAGHPPPLVAPHEGTQRLLATDPGPPIGVSAGAEYPEHQVQLQRGDTLLLFSDGLVERRGVPIDVGLAALRALALPQQPPEDMCEQLIAAMVDRSGDHDDVTCLLIRLEAPPPAASDSPSPAGSPHGAGLTT